MNREPNVLKSCLGSYLRYVYSIFSLRCIGKVNNRRQNILFFLLSTFLVFILTAPNLCAQTEIVKWGKADYSYELPIHNNGRDYSFNSKNVGDIFLKSIADSYWILFSDVDGDNCSFSPTCSSFLLQAVHQTNLFQGTIMFFDRFTRDMDIYKKYDHYPRVKDGHYFDPPSLYTLDENKIKYLPPSEILNK